MDVTVSFIGENEVVMAFNPYWSKAEVYVQEENNPFGLKDGKMQKDKWYFGIGAVDLETSFGLYGGAVVSATVLDSIEVAANIDVDLIISFF